METIPSLNCVLVRVLPAAERQELKANTARGFRVEKADKIDAQNSSWSYLENERKNRSQIGLLLTAVLK